jgi:hypothetical protein
MLAAQGHHAACWRHQVLLVTSLLVAALCALIAQHPCDAFAPPLKGSHASKQAGVDTAPLLTPTSLQDASRSVRDPSTTGRSLGVALDFDASRAAVQAWAARSFGLAPDQLERTSDTKDPATQRHVRWVAGSLVIAGHVMMSHHQ